MKETPTPGKRRKYDAVFRAEALRLAAQSRSTHAAARALTPERLYRWQKEAQTPMAASLGAALAGQVGDDALPGTTHPDPMGAARTAGSESVVRGTNERA